MRTTNNTSKSAIGYSRVSTLDQANEGVSLAMQEERARAWCLANGYQLVAFYSDAGISGRRASNRPQLQKALDHVCGCNGALVVYSLTRLARSLRDTLDIADRLRKADSDLVSIAERLDTTSASGKLMFHLLCALSEFESNIIAERTKAALAHKIKNGERVGSVPFGFDLADDLVSLLPNPQEQGLIALIGRLRENGHSYRDIAAELNKRNTRPKNGQKWIHTAVARIVNRVA